VFGRSKQQPPSHSELVRAELADSYGHLKAAAGHAAGGAAEKLTPHYDKARNAASTSWQKSRAAFEPMYEQMRQGMANARTAAAPPPKKKNRTPVVVVLVATGAALGAAGALVARRRRAAMQWDEYEPAGELEDTEYGASMPSKSPLTSAKEKVTASAAAVAGNLSSHAGKLADSLSEKSSRASDSLTDTADTMAGEISKAGHHAAKSTKDTGERLSEKAAQAQDRLADQSEEIADEFKP
jgi:hypothetical protein